MNILYRENIFLRLFTGEGCVLRLAAAIERAWGAILWYLKGEIALAQNTRLGE
jgi:hypothetical protein